MNSNLRNKEACSMHTIKSVGVLSVAKILGVLYFAMGLIFMPIFLLAGLAGMMAGGREAAFSGLRVSCWPL